MSDYRNGTKKDFSFYNRIGSKATMSILIITFSAMLLSGFLSLLLSGNEVQQETLENEMATALYARELYARTNLSVTDIAGMCTNELVRTRVIEAIDKYKLTDVLRLNLENNEIITVPYSISEHPILLFKLGDGYAEVSVRANRSLIQLAFFRVFLTVGLAFAVLGIFMTYAARRIVSPFTNLSQAMQKVSKGDFSVRLPVKREDELGMLSNNFNQMVQELGSIEYLQKDFISNVSHEFKTPIASVSGYATLLKSSELTQEEREEYIDIIISESQRLSRLSQNLLRLSKLENQHKMESTELFSLDEQLRMSVVLLEPEWAKKEIEWDLDLDEMTYAGEAELLQQVWINILNNAIKFSFEGGKISLKLYQTDMIKVKITDEGIGMTQDVQSRVFDKFYQGDSSHSEDGNGLGLALAKRIVDLFSGSIQIRSAPDKGTTFTISLPKIKTERK